jgi:uncharacterized protein
VTIAIPSATAGVSRRGWTGPVIDADAHVAVPSLDALRPHFARQWNEWIDETGFSVPPALGTKYPAGSSVTRAPEWLPSDGRPAASDLAELQRDVLDPLEVETAIVSCYWGHDSVRNPDFAVELARALNDWLVEEWLDRDPRLRGSLVVPAHNPADAAREIERVGGHPGFVQVLLPLWSSRLYGNRAWLPMWETLVGHGLVAGIHYGGYSDGPTTSTGWTAWFLEEYVSAPGMCWQQLTSILAEGVLREYPDLRLSVLEVGFGWFPAYLWRVDKEWKGLRREIPWVDRPPSEVFRERLRLSIQPLATGPPAQLAHVLGWMGGDEMLMFATDYPHGHETGVEVLLDLLDDDARRRLMADNARAHYRL